MNYVVAGSKPWNKKLFEERLSRNGGQWFFVNSSEGLSMDWLAPISPRYIFFLHWSWKVPEEIVRKYECICFHMADVPFGRGGSPLQNLVVRGYRHTKLSAIRMMEALDAGPVYMKEDLCLEGGAEEVYLRADGLAARIIEEIVARQPKPIPQTGEVVVFKRRRSEESEIPELDSLRALHDFVRMLDAEDYPKAFLHYKGFRYELSRAALYHGRVVADVTVTPISGRGA